MKILKFAFLLGSILFLFSCHNLEKNEQNTSMLILRKDVLLLPKNIQNDSTSLRLVESGMDFPIPFITYIPEDFASYHSQSEDGNIILFKYKNKAAISFTVLPQEEFKQKKLGEKYVKELLSLIAEDVKLQDDGFYRGKSLGRYQNAKVGERNGYIYYWLLDAPFGLKDELLNMQSIIMEQFRWVEK